MRTSAAARRPRSAIERLLEELGADPDFVEAVLGDITEEYAQRVVRDGSSSARWWYAREALRSAPHFLRSAIRHGGPRTRAQLAACFAALALLLTLVVVSLRFRDGPPARLVADGATDRIVINDAHPVQLPIRVLDDAGHRLDTKGVRYQWESGMPLVIAPHGAVTCARRGDATVRASLGRIATDVDVHCRPVREIQASTWVSLVAGGPARHLPFKAIGDDGRVVTELRGAARVLDSSVATLDGASVHPHAVGETAATIQVGDHSAVIRVLVHEPVASFTGLRADQHLVAVPVHLVHADTASWALPAGAFWLKYIPARAGVAPPTVTVAGAIACAPGDGLQVYLLFDEYGVYCVRHPGAARVIVAQGGTGAPDADGWLALEREGQH